MRPALVTIERGGQMLPYQETELKLKLLDPSLYDRIAADPFPGGQYVSGRRKSSDFDNTYYDTADRRLMSYGFMLRVRKSDEGAVATVKDTGTVSGGLFVRGEWTVPLEGEDVSVQAFAGLPIGEKLADAAGQEALEPLFKTAFQRISVDLQAGSALIEFAADRGEIVAGMKREPLYEIELELKSGDAADLVRLGSALAERFPLAIEKKSKFERGLQLAGLSTSKAAGAPSPAAHPVRERPADRGSAAGIQGIGCQAKRGV